MVKVIKNKKDELVTRGILEFELKKGFDKFGKKIDKRFDEERQKNIAFFASKQDLKDMGENIKSELRTDINRNTTYLEKIYAKFEKKEQEDAMHSYAHRLAEDRLANHDKRLEKLEKARVAA